METPINILIVDDEPKNLTVLETVLDDPSYRLVRAESADKALLALVEGEFALLILDIRMPGMTGFELAQIIKERKKTAGVPIIFLTAYYNEDQHVLEGYNTGAVDYLHKPVNPVILRSKVAVFAELHRKQRECASANRALLAEVTERRRVEEQLRELNETLDCRVTERTEALRESERFLQRVAQVTPGVLHVFDLAERRDVFINRSVATLLGYTPDEVQATGAEVVPSLMHPEDLPRFEQHLARVRALADGEVADFEHRMRDPAGEWHWFHSQDAVFARDAAGAARQLIGVATEITERKRAEEKLCDAKEGAEAANRSKDRFLAVLSHELRTPLTPVLMAVAALEHDPELRRDVREDMVMMRRNIELEVKLIDDLLDVSRIASGKVPLNIEPLDLNGAVREVCASFRAQLLDQHVRLALELSGDVGLISADAARLRQVLSNVLRNAVKFTPGQGAIGVTSARLSPERCEVRVCDSGIGIPPEALQHIFEAFEQGDAHVTRQFGGLGLGLTIAKALVELHGGSIRAESAGKGQGATFIIELPGEHPAAAAAATPAVPEGEVAAGLRLLIVEDHPDTARALSRLLAKAGFAVSTASNVATALALAGRETFDLLVSDLGLPDGTGCDVMAGLQKVQPLPGIAMSGYGMDEDVSKSREAGFHEHLVKPVEIPQLIAAIRRVMERKS